DPVYGKGKLSEIQGLILGMLDTFNYEQCLQAKDCGSGSGLERPQQWSCFKCSSNQGGRGGAMVDQRRARSTSLAQTNVTSSLREPGLEAHGKKLFVEAPLDPQQAQSWDHLRCLYHGPSRVGPTANPDC
ncbi:unnamed protein product, partial [Arctogadus glacialis]